MYNHKNWILKTLVLSKHYTCYCYGPFHFNLNRQESSNEIFKETFPRKRACSENFDSNFQVSVQSTRQLQNCWRAHYQSLLALICSSENNTGQAVWCVIFWIFTTETISSCSLGSMIHFLISFIKECAPFLDFFADFWQVLLQCENW